MTDNYEVPFQVTIVIEGGCLRDVTVTDANGVPVEFVYELRDLDDDSDDE